MTDTIESFSIATLSLGKARLGIARLPGRSGDLIGDVATIADWGAACVLSMTENIEMQPYGADALPALLEARGIAHHQFTVRDFGAPEQSDTRWPALAKVLHARLDAGDSVLLHCMGGMGRSGMVALRLLTERGMEPEAALRLVRGARPNAVETTGQEEWGSQGQ